uniref:DUF262 domain-containing protein n=1 Tax=Chryseobacterium aquaticum TaxID=452084 RepID=UPI002FC6D112
MTFTLKELLEQYKIVIPQLQRDYAQGRENETELRKGFISKIKDTLQDEGLPLNLDFIYGYTESTGNSTNAFVPLDGQQRLTTLWILHWYASPRYSERVGDKDMFSLIPEVSAYLKSFTYETRISSKRFCQCLVRESLEINEDILLSEQIMDSPWYVSSWDNDPTVKSILCMVDSFQQSMPDKQLVWENLMKDRITFDYIDIKSDEFSLTDELYIKMNSRGKPLTDFENFKALFSGILTAKNTDYVDLEKTYQMAQVSYQSYFAFKIDGKWMDLFWSYRKKVRVSIDDSILNFLYFISEFLYFRSYSEILDSYPRRDIEFLSKIFSFRDNIDFLFDAFDFLSGIEDVPKFFDNLFEGTSTFDANPHDYFWRCINGTNFEVKDKIILYSVLLYGIKSNKKVVDDDYKDFIRVVRNLLLAVRQPNPKKRIEFTPNLRLSNISDYCKFIDGLVEACFVEDYMKDTYEILATKKFSGFTRETIQHEKYKAETIVRDKSLKNNIHLLEEHFQIQGNASNFSFEGQQVSLKIQSFLEIWNDKVDNSNIIRALLTYGDFSVKTHEYSSIGPIWYYGTAENWNRILTATDREERGKISKVLDMLLSNYLSIEGLDVNDKLKKLIALYVTDERDWQYYFIKYKAITGNGYRKLNVFSWKDDGAGIEINQLGNSGIQPLHSYHLNPYLIAVKRIFKNDPRVTLYYGRFAELSEIKV